MTLLKVRNIETYYGPILAVKGVSFDVQDGAIVTMLGANGAGKTTILKTISGVMDPEKGTIDFMGRRIEGMPPASIVRLGISQVPEGREVFYDLTVQENLMMGAYIRNDRRGVQDDLRLVYDYFPILEKRSNQYSGDMSGGEQQMIVIARALMARPKLMLLDEPSLGLSPLLVKEIYEIIVRINQEQKTTILLVEQNAPMALSVAGHGFVLELGRIVMDDTCEALRENEDVKEFYLGIKEESVRGTRRWKRKKKWR
ncbi:MAG: ABC transporter ATP-binding protein [Desulfatiglans sp.]|jgi:branched-chain amino acid transport system ATP-binding protein|nr:ABC transporter ATP-binding protein [Thermodesulfobacteriota bacterium]MEE4352827.1 ABC transporter ATP-binding protein [Desulfatiglans sp.]